MARDYEGQRSDPILSILRWREPLTLRQREIQQIVIARVQDSLAEARTRVDAAEEWGLSYRTVARWLVELEALNNGKRIPGRDSRVIAHRSRKPRVRGTA